MRPYKRRISALLGATILMSLVLVACGGTGESPPLGTSSPQPNGLPCRGADSQVAAPSDPHGLFVVIPPSTSYDSRTYGINTLKRYLVTNPEVCGALLSVPWSAIDRGPGAKHRYEWKDLNQIAAPWIAAGKSVGFAFESVAYLTSGFGGVGATPDWVLREGPTVDCGGDVPDSPVFWNPSFVRSWDGFIRAVVRHVALLPWVDYLRFGVGAGMEDFPTGITESTCFALWQAHGYLQQFPAYTSELLSYEARLGSVKPITVSINPLVHADNRLLYPTAVTQQAISLGLGIGFQGLGVQGQGEGLCYMWCPLFREAAGQVALELQTYSPTSPGGEGPTPPLPGLLRLAFSQHTQLFELWPQDWLVAFDPHWQGYRRYHSVYRRALERASTTVNGNQP